MFEVYEERTPRCQGVQVLTDNVHELARYFEERNITASITYGGKPGYGPKLMLEGHPSGIIEAQAGGTDDGDWLVNLDDGMTVVPAREFRLKWQPAQHEILRALKLDLLRAKAAESKAVPVHGTNEHPHHFIDH